MPSNGTFCHRVLNSSPRMYTVQDFSLASFWQTGHVRRAPTPTNISACLKSEPPVRKSIISRRTCININNLPGSIAMSYPHISPAIFAPTNLSFSCRNLAILEYMRYFKIALLGFFPETELTFASSVFKSLRIVDLMHPVLPP